MRFNLEIEFTIGIAKFFRTAWYGPIEIDIIVNLFILNNIFMVSWFFIWMKYTRGTRFLMFKKLMYI